MGRADAEAGDAPALLGFKKNTLRFIPHGSTTKAHVMLRRVETSPDESSEDEFGVPKPAVYYTLIAAKRIEVKPGKEILLALQTDGPLKDKAVILTGHWPTEEDEDSDLEDAEKTQVADDEDEVSMPPKMRKSWIRREELPPLAMSAHTLGMLPIYNSVAVQAQPDVATSSIQVDPPPPPARHSASIQAMPEQGSVSIQATPSSNSTSVQAVPSTVSALVQASPSQSNISVQVKPSQISVSIEAIPPPAASRISHGSQIDPPLHASASVQADYAPPPSQTPLSLLHSPLPEPASMEVTPPQVALEVTPPQAPLKVTPPQASLKVPLPQPTRPRSLSPMEIESESDSETGPSTPPAPEQPVRPLVKGDSVGSLAGEESVEAIHTPPLKKESELPVASGSNVTLDVVEPAPTRPATPPVKEAAAASRRRRSRTPSSADTVPAEPAKRVRKSDAAPKGHAMSLRRSKEAKETPPPPPATPTANGRTASPPPDAKSLVYLPTGPASNPLSIRPSMAMPAAMRGAFLGGPAPPTGPASLTGRAKKPLVVGSGWPRVRATSEKEKEKEKVAVPTKEEERAPSSSPVLTTVPLKKESPAMGTIELGAYTLPPPPPPPLQAEPAKAEPALEDGINGRASKSMSLSPPPTPPRVAPPSLPAEPEKTANKWQPISVPSAPVSEPPPAPPEPEVRPPSPPPAKAPAKKKGGRKTATKKRSAAVVKAFEQLEDEQAKPKTKGKAAAPKRAPLFVPATGESLSGSTPPPSASAAAPPATSLPATSHAHSAASPHAQSAASPHAEPSHSATVSSGPVPYQYPAGYAMFGLFPTNPQMSLFYPPPVPGTPAPPLPSSSPSSSSAPATPAVKELKPPGVMVHPLPPKPAVVADQRSYPRGVKRAAASAMTPVSPVTLITPEAAKREKESELVLVHSVRVKGDAEVREIVFDSTGAQFAVACQDKSVRIFNNTTRAEVAMLQHTAPVVSVAWLADDSGILSLGDTGIVSRWKRVAVNRWNWAKELDVNDGKKGENCAPVAMAFVAERIAVVTAKGVRLWIWTKGAWSEQRAILRQNVTTIKFVEGGQALLGATSDGVLWYSQVPNGTLRALTFLSTRILALDVDSAGENVLVTQSEGVARLVCITDSDERGKVQKSFQGRTGDVGAVFAVDNSYVLYALVDSALQIWDRHKGDVASKLQHSQGADVQAVASFDNNATLGPYAVTGTKQGLICWWPMPSPASAESPTAKRAKTS